MATRMNDTQLSGLAEIISEQEIDGLGSAMQILLNLILDARL